MSDDYEPCKGTGGKNSSDRGDKDHHCLIFDTLSIGFERKIERGLVRPIKYIVVPEFTFISDKNGMELLQTDDQNGDKNGKIKPTGGSEIAAMAMKKPISLKLKKSWSSDDSDGGVPLGNSLTTDAPFRESWVASSLHHSFPFATNQHFNHSPSRKSRDRSLSPTSDGTSPRSAPPTSPNTLHFHRKTHHAAHDHHHSVTPTPFTCTKTRKYMLLNRVPDPPLVRYQKAEPHLDNITNHLEKLHVRPSSPWVYSPLSLREALQRWAHDKSFMQDAERLERENRFRGIDMNEGWNRARTNGWQFTVDVQYCAPYFEGGAEMRMKIAEAFNRFSLWSQLEPIEWDEEELEGMFDVVFVGEGLGSFGWTREPGTWWAARKRLFDGHRGRCLLEEIDLWVEDIVDGLEKWKRENRGMLYAIGSLKRKVSSTKIDIDAECDRRRKRAKPDKTKSEQVMTEEWRARRRMQEKKAGRWTDGTVRMDRMWAEFHWVLNADDPREEFWPKKQFY